jgi:hypothetical protein
VGEYRGLMNKAHPFYYAGAQTFLICHSKENLWLNQNPMLSVVFANTWCRRIYPSSLPNVCTLMKNIGGNFLRILGNFEGIECTSYLMKRILLSEEMRACSCVVLNVLSLNAQVATVLASIPASVGTVESEGRQMKQCCILYEKEKKVLNVRSCSSFAILQPIPNFFFFLFKSVRHDFTFFLY